MKNLLDKLFKLYNYSRQSLNIHETPNLKDLS